MDEKSRPEISLQHCSHEVLQLATNFTTDYLDYMENLPFDLQRKVTKLREVDQKCREHVKEIERLYENFVKENDGSTSFKRRSYLLKIQQLFALCKELGDEKIAIVQSISEVIEARNKQLEMGSKKFKLAYEPSVKQDHNSKKDKDSKSDASKGTKRSRRQRSAHSVEKQEKVSPPIKEEKAPKLSYIDDIEEPPSKIAAPESPEPTVSVAVPTPALTRAAQRDEDKRTNAKLAKDRKEEKNEDDETVSVVSTASSKVTTEVSATSTITTTSSTTATSASTSSSKQTKNNGSSNNSSSSMSGKANNKGKKKKRKANKQQNERQTSNGGEVSPLLDMPIDPDEPTYCLCQQVSFGQMIGCDNPKCPIEWFHFSCVRLTHKPKGRWYCPDCTIKMKERKREGKRGDHR